MTSSNFFAIPAQAGIHALSSINDLHRAWAPAVCHPGEGRGGVAKHLMYV